MDDKALIRGVTIEFESGIERDTSIRFFVECALEDDEATVWDPTREDHEVTDIEEVEKVEAAA